MRSNRVPSTDEIARLFSAAGYRAMNPLQQRLVPHVLKGRDIVIQAGPGSGRTVGCLVPFMAALRGVREGVRVLIIAADAEKVRKIAREHARFSRVVREAPPLLTLGDTEDARKEGRRLEGAPVILAGTVERVITHIRRGSIPFTHLSSVVIEETGGDLAADFIRDVQFIFAKLPPRRQVVLFARDASKDAVPQPGAETGPAGQPLGGISEFLHHPVVLTGQEPVADTGSSAAGTAYLEVGSTAKDRLLWRLIVAKDAYPVLVLHSVRTDGEKLARGLAGFPVRTGVISSSMLPASRRRLALAFEARELDVLFAPMPVSAELDASLASLLIYFDVPVPRPSGGPAPAGAPRRQDPLRSGRRVLVLVDAGQARDFQRLQEALAMNVKKEDHPADGDVIRGSIDRIVRKVKDEEDPKELDRIRSIFRKQVPFFMRSYVAAYLLKSHLPRPEAAVPVHPAERQRQRGGERARPRGEPAPQRGERPPRGEPAPQRGERPPRGEPAPQRSERPPGGGRPAAGEGGRGSRQQAAAVEPRGGFTQLFVSIGRNRRVYPRDLTELFTEALKLGAEEIGSVRVFDKYSFVEIATHRAEEAISRLSGKDFKGRPISVNFAKKREEKEGS